MAGKDIKSQLNLSLNLKLGRGGKSIAQELAQTLSKEISQAVTQALQESTATVKKARKQATAEAVKDETRAADQVERYKTRLQGESARAARRFRDRTAKDDERDLEREERRKARLQMGSIRISQRSQADEERAQLRAARAIGTGFRNIGREAEAEESMGRQAAAGLGRGLRSIGREHAQDQKEQLREQRRGDKGTNQEAKRAAQTTAREQRRVSQAEREIARLEGRPDPQLEQLDRDRPGLGGRLGRARQLAAMFPGSARIAQATGMSVNAVRGGMSALPMLAGMATGTRSGGIIGGLTSGTQLSTLLGLGRGAGALLGAGMGAIGLVGALGVQGFNRSMNNAPAAIRFRGAGFPSLRVAPSQQGNLGVHRGAFEDLLFRQAALGMDPMEAAQLAGTFTQGAGGFGGSRSMRAGLSEMFQLRQGFGVDAGTSAQFEFARRRGGMTGIAGLAAGQIGTRFAQQAVGLGFQGQEIPDLLAQLAGSAGQARGMGTFANLGSQMSTIGALSPSIGQFQGARFAGGLQGALSNVATQGVGGAGNPAMGLMLMQAFGGLQLGKKGGVSAEDIFSAQQRIETQGATPEGVGRMMGFCKQAGGGSRGLQGMMMQRGLGQLGISMGPGLIRSLQRGGPATSDIAATITGAAEGQAELAALGRGGGVGGRAEALAPREMRMDAATRGTDIRSGLVRAELSQQMDASGAALGRMTSEIGIVNDALKVFGDTIHSMSIP